MSKLETYDSIKSSGIQWVGDIPSHWHVHTLYQLVSQVKNKNSDLREKNLLSLSYGKIKRKDINSSDGLLPASFDGYNIIEDGDIVLRLTDLQNDHTSLRVGLSNERGIITSAYTTLRPIDKSTSKYLYYLLYAFDLKKGFYGMGAGVRQGLNYDTVKELRVILPSSEQESKEITRYLDEKVSKVNLLIESAKRCIEDYRNWRDSLISKALTKGINKYGKVKESGIDHIGLIPISWKVARIKYLANIEPTCDKSHLVNSDIVSFAPMECIRTDCRISRVSSLAHCGSHSCFMDGDIALAKVTPCFENKNVCIMENLENGFAFGSTELINLRAINIRPRFLLYWLQTEKFIEDGKANMSGVAGLKRVPPSYVKNAYMTLPPNEEQDEIIQYLDKQCKIINSLSQNKQELIDDLESYKRSLIYEVVTGKRKVV